MTLPLKPEGAAGQSMRRDDRIRRCIAQEAARLMYEEGVREYRDAKRKAARHFGPEKAFPSAPTFRPMPRSTGSCSGSSASTKRVCCRNGCCACGVRPSG